jgi:hypothetical protein
MRALNITGTMHMKQYCSPDEVPLRRLLHRLQTISDSSRSKCSSRIIIRRDNMAHISSQLVALGMVAALGLVTTNTVQAANVALATNGAVASASSTGFGDFAPSSASNLIDDRRSGFDS